MTLDRRQFLSRLAAYCTAAGIPAFALADDDERRQLQASTSHGHDDDRRLPATGLSGRMVVVGGGMAGAAVAKFLRLGAGPACR